MTGDCHVRFCERLGLKCLCLLDIEKVLEPRFINLSKKSEGSKVDFILQTEALNAIRKMPSWNPGKISGKVVDVTCTIAIKFSMAPDDRKLENEKIVKMGDFPLITIFGH